MLSFYLRYPQLIRLNRVLIPIKAHHRVIFKKTKTCQIKLAGRLTFGNKKLALSSGAPSNIQLGNHSQFICGRGVNIGPGVNIIQKEKSILEIGENTYFTADSRLEVVNKISIGSDCAISWGTSIIDDNHHTIYYENKNKATSNEVGIGNHVWIGCQTVILPGTSIGDNCIIAAGSVVKGSFPENTLIAGNPAKVIKNDVSWK